MLLLVYAVNKESRCLPVRSTSFTSCHSTYRAWVMGSRLLRSCILESNASWNACAAVGEELLPAHVWRCQKAARSSFCAGIGKQWGDARKC